MADVTGSVGAPDRAQKPRVGCYPGSFNPPTVAHLAVAEAALLAGDLDRIELVVSRTALGKEEVAVPSLDDRMAVLRHVAATRSWLGVAVSDHELVTDLAAGYDAVVMGTDKWRQVNHATGYGDDPAARDAALARLPLVLLAPRADDDLAELAELASPEAVGRAGHPDLSGNVVLLTVPEDHRYVSATAVRTGQPGADAWWLPEAAAFDARTHAWSDPARYRSEDPPPPG